MKKIKLLIADDHAVVRMGLVALLESEKDISVIGATGDGEETVAKAFETRPDVVLMDLVMPKIDGAEATRKIKLALPNAHILVLTTFSDTDDIRRALNAGADGAMLKNSDYTDVIAAIRKVAAGECCVSSEVRKMLAEHTPAPKLSDRQLEVLSAMCRGLTNADIAKILDITPDGVKFHITTIFAKLGAANRSEAVGIAIKKHLLKI